jgi:hypothetical protein
MKRMNAWELFEDLDRVLEKKTGKPASEDDKGWMDSIETRMTLISMIFSRGFDSFSDIDDRIGVESSKIIENVEIVLEEIHGLKKLLHRIRRSVNVSIALIILFGTITFLMM